MVSAAILTWCSLRPQPNKGSSVKSMDAFPVAEGCGFRARRHNAAFLFTLKLPGGRPLLNRRPPSCSLTCVSTCSVSGRRCAGPVSCYHRFLRTVARLTPAGKTPVVSQLRRTSGCGSRRWAGPVRFSSSDVAPIAAHHDAADCPLFWRIQLLKPHMFDLMLDQPLEPGFLFFGNFDFH
jgi:hypothetical protein